MGEVAVCFDSKVFLEKRDFRECIARKNVILTTGRNRLAVHTKHFCVNYRME